MRTWMITSVVVAAMITIACGDTGDTRAPASQASPEQAKAVVSAGGGQPKAQTACDLLSPSEIATFLKVSDVQKDDINSGRNEFSGVEICNWSIKEGNQGVEVRLRRAASIDQGDVSLAFSAAKGDAVEHDAERSSKMQPVAVGDEGLYAPFPIGPGGSVVFRVGRSIATITASGSKDTVVSMATLAAKRM